MYKKVKSSWMKHIDFMVLDLVCMQIAFVIAYMMRNGVELPYKNVEYQQIGVLLALLHICVVFFDESYKSVLKRGLLKELKAVIKQVSLVMSMILCIMFFQKNSLQYSRVAFIWTWGISIVLEYGMHIVMKRYIRYRNVKSTNLRSVIVATSSDIVQNVVDTILMNQYSDFKITGIAILDQDMRGTHINNIPIVATSDDVLDYVKNNIVDEVFINLSRELELTDALVNGCINMGAAVHLNLMWSSRTITDKTVQNFGGYMVLSQSIKMATPRQLFFKRLIDICGGIVGVFVTALVTILVAPIIYAQSPGPIFFSQVRVGKNGRKFKIYKFRSMYTDAEERKKELMAQNEMSGFMFKMKNDPRIFPFGAFMRKTSIDELPQLLNVLKGDMSLVGTRPPTVDEYEQYEQHHKSRLAIKPGVTGMWQVSGRSEITDFEDVVALDREYITGWNLGMDLKILMKTVKVVIWRSGSV